MGMKRRNFVVGAAALTGLSGASAARAQDSILEQAKILVGFPPGAGADSLARLVAEEIRGKYARTVVVENKPGASGRLAVDEVNRGPIDGSLMIMQPDAVMALQPHVDPKNTNYKFEDLVPVISCAQYDSTLVVGPMVPDSVRTMKAFLDWAKANPTIASYGVPATASPQDFLMRIAMKSNNFELVQVPYRGGAPGLRDAAGGQLAAMFTFIGDALPLQASGKVRMLGTSGVGRSKFTPDVPTFVEQGFVGMSLPPTRMGLWMKRGVPEAQLDRLHNMVAEALKKPSVVAFMSNIAYEVSSITQAEAAKAAEEAYKAWGERVRATGYKPPE